MILVVDGQRIYNYEYQEPQPIATNSLGFIDIEFRMSEEWDGYICTAQFVQHKENGTDFVASKVLYNNHVTFPDGIIPGVLEISLFGYKAGEAERGTTFPYIQPVCRSGFTSTEATPIPPTPDLYSQFLESFETTKQSIENDKQTVQNASKDAITARDYAVEAAKSAKSSEQNAIKTLENIKKVSTDLIESIETAGATQISNVQSEGATQISSVKDAGGEQSRALSAQGDTEQRKVIAAGDEQVSRVTNAGNGAVESVTLEKTNAVNSVQSTKVEAVNSVETAKTSAVEAVKSVESAAIQNIGTGVDDTLSISGKAADAKKTGDSISSLKNDIDELSKYANPFVENCVFSTIVRELYIDKSNYSGSLDLSVMKLYRIDRARNGAYLIGFFNESNQNIIFSSSTYTENDMLFTAETNGARIVAFIDWNRIEYGSQIKNSGYMVNDCCYDIDYSHTYKTFILESVINDENMAITKNTEDITEIQDSLGLMTSEHCFIGTSLEGIVKDLYVNKDNYTGALDLSKMYLYRIDRNYSVDYGHLIGFYDASKASNILFYSKTYSESDEFIILETDGVSVYAKIDWNNIADGTRINIGSDAVELDDYCYSIKYSSITKGGFEKGESESCGIVSELHTNYGNGLFDFLLWKSGVSHKLSEDADALPFIICCGQSNAEGRVDPSTVDFLNAQHMKNYYMFDAKLNSFRRYNVFSNNGNGTKNNTYFNGGSDKVGMDVFFANKYLSTFTSKPLLCIKHAFGGVGVDKSCVHTATPPYSWYPLIDYRKDGYESMFTELISKIKRAEDWAKNMNKKLYPIGLLWLQGEKDAIYAPSSYSENFSNVINVIRSIVNSPNLPVFAGHIIQGDESSATRLINNQIDIVSQNDEFVKSINMDEVNSESIGDNLHYNAIAHNYLSNKILREYRYLSDWLGEYRD